MPTVTNATDVRKDWGRFIDDVVRDGPRFVRRNRDSLVAIGTDQLKVILSTHRFHMEAVEEPDGSFSGSVQEIDVVASAPSPEALRNALAHELIDYALIYSERFAFHFNAPNRRSHAPYVLNILLQDDVEAVAALIDA